MTTSKFLVSTLIAAAAMTATAYADSVSLENGSTHFLGTDGTGAGNTYSYNGPAGEAEEEGAWLVWGSALGDGTSGMKSLGTAGSSTFLTGTGLIGLTFASGSGNSEGTDGFDLTNVDASAFAGSLVAVNQWNNSTNVKVSGETWKNTTYVFAGVSHEIWKSSGSPWRMYNDTARGRDTLTLSGATTFSGIQGTSKGFTVINGSNVAVSTNAYEFIGAETAGTVLTIAGAKENSFYGTVGSSSVAVGVNMTGTGTQVFGGTNYFDVVSTVSGSTLDLSGSTTSIAGAVTNAGTLNLSGATVSLSSAISNTGTVTVSDATAFVLDNLYADGVFSVISGGTIAGWENLDLSRQTYKGVALSTGRGSSASEAGKLSMNVGDLVWSGSVSSNWNLSDANWTGEDGVFHTFDNVTFNATAENRLVAFESGANIVVGTVSVEGEGVEYSWNVGEGQTATVSGDSLTVGSGATLNLGLEHDRHVLELDFDRISVSGKLNYTNGSTTWGALELNEDGEIYLGDTVTTDGLIIDSTTVTGSAKITAGTWGQESINLGEVSGQGDLLITGTTSTELSYATRVFATDLTQYSGTISLVRGSENATKLVMSVDHSAVASSTKIAVGSGTVLAVNGANQQETNLSGVTGTGTIEFAAVGNTSDTGGNDGSFSQIQLGNGFTGTLSVTSGVLDLLEAGGSSAIKEARLGGVATVNLNGGGILFRNNSEGVFTKNITVGDNGGVIRLYGNGNMSISGDVTGTGTLRHTDGGTLTFTGKVDVGTFRQVAGTTKFAGGTQNIEVFNLSAGTAEFTNETTLTSGVSTFSGGKFHGNLTIGKDAIVWGTAGDTLDYNAQTEGTLKVQGVLNLGQNTGEEPLEGARWSFGGSNKLVLDGGTINGKGDGKGYALDFFATNTVRVTADSTINANIVGRGGSGSAVLTFDIDEGKALTINGNFCQNATNDTDGILEKDGQGKLILEGTKSSGNEVRISEGTLVVANASALGTGKTTVKAGATLTFATTVSGVTGGVEINEGATFAIDLTGFTQTVSEGDEIGFAILTNTALTFNGQGANTLSSGDIERYFDVEGSTLGAYSEWAREWSYNTDSNTLSLTMTIPEPSAFGLLAGVGALALVVSRRKRRK